MAIPLPHWLRAVVGVSPVMDLQPSADALHDPRNRVYEWNFLRNMLARYRRKAELFPGSLFARELQASSQHSHL